MDDKQLAKLIKKTAAKAAKSSSKLRPATAYDPTLQNREEHESDEDRKHFFKEMKKREF